MSTPDLGVLHYLSAWGHTNTLQGRRRSLSAHLSAAGPASASASNSAPAPRPARAARSFPDPSPLRQVRERSAGDLLTPRAPMRRLTRATPAPAPHRAQPRATPPPLRVLPAALSLSPLRLRGARSDFPRLPPASASVASSHRAALPWEPTRNETPNISST